MRTLGIMAVFVLAVCAITEGAFLFRLSAQVRDLSHQVASAHEVSLRDSAEAPSVAPARAPPSALRPLTPARSAAAPPAFTAPTPALAATTTLRDALATSEGRDHLRAAMDIIAEQRRQERLVATVERREERDQRFKERLNKLPLTGDEPQKISALFTALATGRHQLLEDMRAGAKNAEDTDEAMDELQDTTQKALRTLIGDDRWSKVQSERRGRQGNVQRPEAARPTGAPAQTGG
jgi:hypothetical protein